VPKTHSKATDFGYTPQRVADLLVVVMWPDSHLWNEMRTVVTSSPRVGLGAVLVSESLLVSVRPVSDARSELAQLARSLLLAGFEIWGKRQRAVVRKLATSATKSQ